MRAHTKKTANACLHLPSPSRSHCLLVPGARGIPHHACFGMTVDVFVELVGAVKDGHLMIEAQFLQPGGNAEKGHEDPQMRWMRLRPALQEIQRAPVTDVVAFLQQIAVKIYVLNIAVAIAAQRLAVVTQEVHALDGDSNLKLNSP